MAETERVMGLYYRGTVSKEAALEYLLSNQLAIMRGLLALLGAK